MFRTYVIQSLELDVVNKALYLIKMSGRRTIEKVAVTKANTKVSGCEPIAFLSVYSPKAGKHRILFIESTVSLN